MNLKKTALSAAVTTAIGLGSAVASADTINGTFNGLFTLLSPDGTSANNNGDASGPPWYGNRTPVTGTMTFDTDTGAGSATIPPFSFFAGGPATATSITFQAIGDGAGGPGPLVLGNLGFNWSGTNGIPVSIVLDASGFFGAVAGGLTTGDIVVGGSLAATDDFLFGAKASYTLPIGPSPMVTTTFDTTTIDGAGIGTNPSGTLPLSDDGIGGSPMVAGPFPGFNANFDFTDVTVTSYIPTVIPVPAAVWLFGSGLLGLVGVARRKKSA